MPPITITLNAAAQGNNNWDNFSGSTTVSRDGAHSVSITNGAGNWYRDLNVTASAMPPGVTITLGNITLNGTPVTHNRQSLTSTNLTANFHQAWGNAGNLISNLTGGHIMGGDGNQQFGIAGNPIINNITLNFTVSGAGGGPVSTPAVTTTASTPPTTTTTLATTVTSPPTTTTSANITTVSQQTTTTASGDPTNVQTTTSTQQPPGTTTTIITTQSPVTTASGDPTGGQTTTTTLPPVTTTESPATTAQPLETGEVARCGGCNRWQNIVVGSNLCVDCFAAVTVVEVTTRDPNDPIPTRRKGDITDTGDITIVDALELLMFLAGLENEILSGDPLAMEAARITVEYPHDPTIACVLEILMYLAGLETIIPPKPEA
jgi:hypothetical protein